MDLRRVWVGGLPLFTRTPSFFVGGTANTGASQPVTDLPQKGLLLVRDKWPKKINLLFVGKSGPKAGLNEARPNGENMEGIVTLCFVGIVLCALLV